MKKKIGILTFQQCINYGAILQTYALQHLLNENGYNAEVIDYRNSVFNGKYTFRRYLKKLPLKYMIYNYVTMPFWIRKKHKFVRFTKKYIKISAKVTHCKDDFKYDKYLVGSDQVWNVQTTGYDKTYFLDFVKDDNKKYSYAASFGVSELDNRFTRGYDLLKRFKGISVREAQGEKIIKDNFNINSTVVLDPTLLLKENDWKKVAKVSKETGYILIYQLAYSKTLVEFAKKVAMDKNLKIITIDGNPRQPLKAKYVLDAGPAEWLGLFINADYVITNSFHGLAFSINLNKNFFFEYLGNGLNVNSRLKNVADLFKIENRLISNNLEKVNYELPNYREINEILEKERKKSISWLFNNMSD